MQREDPLLLYKQVNQKVQDMNKLVAHRDERRMLEGQEHKFMKGVFFFASEYIKICLEWSNNINTHDLNDQDIREHLFSLIGLRQKYPTSKHHHQQLDCLNYYYYWGNKTAFNLLWCGGTIFFKFSGWDTRAGLIPLLPTLLPKGNKASLLAHFEVLNSSSMDRWYLPNTVK